MNAAFEEAYAGAPASRIPEARHRFHVDHRSGPLLDRLGNREPKSKKRAEVIDTHLVLKLINGGGVTGPSA
jgi:hypothetical protein